MNLGLSTLSGLSEIAKSDKVAAGLAALGRLGETLSVGSGKKTVTHQFVKSNFYCNYNNFSMYKEVVVILKENFSTLLILILSITFCLCNKVFTVY